MGRVPKQLQDFMAKHKIASDEIWEVRNGAYAIKHFAIERIAANAGIVFDRPAILEHDAAGSVSMIVFGKLGEREEWSTGEASPKNNKNAYPYAMAEKRGKGRVALKLLTAKEGMDAALYSEEDSDDFKQGTKRQNPHVTRAEDIIEHEIEYDERGQPIDNIPLAETPVTKMKVKDARPEFQALVTEMETECTSVVKLERWAKSAADTIAALSPEWQKILRGKYAERLKELREGIAA